MVAKNVDIFKNRIKWLKIFRELSKRLGESVTYLL
jgi:hypothetical protein